MTTHRFPLLIWQDFEGRFTAALVEQFPASAGIGQTADEAVSQLKEYLTWYFQDRPWADGSDFHEPKLDYFKVSVRPEYQVEKRVFPCREQVTLRVACVSGKQEDGLLVASMPLLGLRFYYHEPESLAELVVRYAQEALKGFSPREVSRFLPPRSAVLDDLAITVRHKKERLEQPAAPKTLSTVAEPLGDRTFRRQYAQPWERDAEVADLVRRIREERANVILLGESGVGKTSVLVEAVRRIERQGLPEDDAAWDDYPRKFWITSGARIIAGMRYLGQWEQRCEAIVDELSNLGGVLAVENLLDLVRAADEDARASVAAFLLPYLHRGELRLIGEATALELDACRRLLPGFADVFQILAIEPFDRTKALSALSKTASILEQSRGVHVPGAVVDHIYRLFRRFMPYQVFPGRAVGFLKDAVDRAAIDRAPDLTLDRAINHFARETGLPELFLRDETPLAASAVLAAFREQVVGQEAGCRAATNLVTTFKAGLNDPGRPLGVLLLCGPTGVGKTELAKAISRFFFGHGEKQDRLVRLDMSEYGLPGAASRLASRPDGTPSDLVEQIRKQPFNVVLFDEIEKAAPEVFDVLLSVFDEGRLTDRYGRTTTFRSAIILMTSNLGAGAGEAIGFGEASATRYENEAMAWFRPEFFNRIDAVVTFQHLGVDTIRTLATRELSALAAREGLEKAGLSFVWTDGVIDLLARVGYDARYGARPLQRTVETLVVAPLARFLVEHPGLCSATIQCDLDAEGRVCLALFTST